jgi:sugar phosphate isomerase/epimerase
MAENKYPLDMNYTHILYGGNPSSLDPEFSGYFSGYRVPAGQLAATTNPQTANILKEVSDKVSSGVKSIELTMIQPQIFESVPKQYLKEVNRLAKLTGLNISVHGPVINPSGVSQQGFNEIDREKVERTLTNSLAMSQEVNPDGNVIMTVHSSEGLPSPEIVKEEGKAVIKGMFVVDKDKGRITRVEEEIKYRPGAIAAGKIEGKKETVEDQIDTLNSTQWDNELFTALQNKERGDQILDQGYELIAPQWAQYVQGKLDPKNLTPTQFDLIQRAQNAHQFISESERTLNASFDKAWKMSEGDEERRKDLKKIAEDFGKNANPANLRQHSQAMQNLMNGLKHVEPELFEPLDTFAMKTSSKTFGNAAFSAFKDYQKKGKNAPILSIENPPVGQQFSRGEDIKNMVENSRKVFAENAMKELGMSESEARKAAEKHIGATWDVGHINMIRKEGFDENDVVRESEQVKPFIKHIHLSDNFGLEHTELPMGMGNVPLAKIMEKLGKSADEVQKVAEISSMFRFHGVQQFPFKEMLTGLGSPIYSSGIPYWNQAAGFEQGYFGGYGQFLPQKHFEMYGGGFSQLPAELGGNIQGGRNKE